MKYTFLLFFILSTTIVNSQICIALHEIYDVVKFKLDKRYEYDSMKSIPILDKRELLGKYFEIYDTCNVENSTLIQVFSSLPHSYNEDEVINIVGLVKVDERYDLGISCGSWYFDIILVTENKRIIPYVMYSSRNEPYH